MFMHSLYANTLNETEKLWKRRRTKAFLLLTALVPIVSAVLLSLGRNHAAVLGMMGSNLPMSMLGLFTFALLPLFLFMTAADSFSGEAASRTLKLVLVRPISRSQVFASKAAAIAIYAAVHLGLLWIVSVLAGWFVPGEDWSGWLPDSLTAYAAAFVPMLAIGLIAVLIAQCPSSTTGVMALAVILYAAAKLLPFIFPQLAVWSVFSYTNWYVLWVGKGISIGKLTDTFVLLLSYCIMAYTAGWMVFDRKQW